MFFHMFLMGFPLLFLVLILIIWVLRVMVWIGLGDWADGVLWVADGLDGLGEVDGGEDFEVFFGYFYNDCLTSSNHHYKPLILRKKDLFHHTLRIILLLFINQREQLCEMVLFILLISSRVFIYVAVFGMESLRYCSLSVSVVARGHLYH